VANKKTADDINIVIYKYNEYKYKIHSPVVVP